MIPGDLSHSTTPHVWSNASHRNFRAKFLVLNASCYLLHVSNENLRASLLSTLISTEVHQGSFAGYAVGHVTAGTRSSLKGLHVAKDDGWYVVDNMQEFLSLVQRQTIIGAHRIMADYCFDLLAELIRIRVIPDDRDLHRKVAERNLSLGDVPRVLERAGVWFDARESLPADLRLLAETRNCFEHDDGRVSATWQRLSGRNDISVGEPIPVTAEMAGDALDHVDAAANLINQRAVGKYPKLLDFEHPQSHYPAATIKADWKHAIQPAPSVPTPYRIPALRALCLDISSLERDLLRAPTTGQPNQVQLRLGQYFLPGPALCKYDNGFG